MEGQQYIYVRQPLGTKCYCAWYILQYENHLKIRLVEIVLLWWLFFYLNLHFLGHIAPSLILVHFIFRFFGSHYTLSLFIFRVVFVSAFGSGSQRVSDTGAGISSYFFCRNLVVKQVALMVMLTRASRFLGTMWYYYSLLLTFTSITFFHYISGMFASCNAPGAVLGGRGRQGKNRRKDCEQPLRTDCLKYKQLDIIVEFLLEHCKELVRQVLAVCSTHHLQ